MSVVYLAARDQGFRQLAAVKVLHPDRAADPDARTRFLEERNIIAWLGGAAGLVSLLDAGDLPEDGRPYLVTTYAEGSPLTEHCDRRELSIPQRLELFLRLLEVVGHVHDKGVIHRDIKPANVLVSPSGAPIPLDFGIAKIVNRLGSVRDAPTEPHVVYGTRDYVSPERYDAHAEANPAVDVYSLGKVLYQLLTGALPPGPGAESDRVLSRVLRPSRSAVGPAAEREGDASRRLGRTTRADLAYVVRKALDENPVHRYGSVGDLAADLRRVLQDRRIRTRSYPLWAWDLVWRHRVAALLLLALAACAGWALSPAAPAAADVHVEARANDYLPRLGDHIRRAREEITFVDVNFYTTVPERRDLLLDRLRDGVHVKVLLFDFLGPAAADVARSFGETQEVLRSQCVTTAEVLASMRAEVRAKRYPGRLEARFSAHSPGARFYLFDPRRPDGAVYLVPHVRGVDSPACPASCCGPTGTGPRRRTRRPSNGSGSRPPRARTGGRGTNSGSGTGRGSSPRHARGAGGGVRISFTGGARVLPRPDA